ncbi:MAG TPA: hypothetical protein VFQ65_28190 [Kofleriaceae bacterium]|nr:hypothetical protein [Kofleriaceae bacterium]
MKLALLALVAFAACHDEPVKACTPAAAHTKTDVLALLRRHRTMVDQKANGRDVKLVDDEIRIAEALACQPCEWVGDRLTVDEMVPLARLDDATATTCLGLVLRDGSTVYGRARP